MAFHKQQKFSVVEILLVVVFLAVLAGLTFIVLDSSSRFANARDSIRADDVQVILSAIKMEQVNHQNTVSNGFANLTKGDVYMITDGNPAQTNCQRADISCDTPVTKNFLGENYCVNLDFLVQKKFLARVPISPNGSGIWTKYLTGYTLSVNPNGTVIVRACESENTSEIQIFQQ